MFLLAVVVQHRTSESNTDLKLDSSGWPGWHLEGSVLDSWKEESKVGMNLPESDLAPTIRRLPQLTANSIIGSTGPLGRERTELSFASEEELSVTEGEAW